MPDVKFLFLVKVQYNVKFYGQTFNENYTHKWDLSLVPVNNLNLDSVTFILHESFPNRERKFTKPPYKVKESGYGTFEMNIKMNLFGKTYSEVYDIVLFQDATYKSITNYFVLSRKISSKHFQLALENGGIPVPDDYLRDNKSMNDFKDNLSVNGHEILPQNYFLDLYKYVNPGVSVVTKRLSEQPKKFEPISNSKSNFNDQKCSSLINKNKHQREITDVSNNSSSRKKCPNPQIAGRKIIKSDSKGSNEDISVNSQQITSSNSNKCEKNMQNIDMKKICRNDSDSSDFDAEDIFRKSSCKLDMLMKTGFSDTDEDNNIQVRARKIQKKGILEEYSENAFCEKRNRIIEKNINNVEDEINEYSHNTKEKKTFEKQNFSVDKRNSTKNILVKENKNNSKSTESKSVEKSSNLSHSQKKLLKKKDFVLTDGLNLKNELNSFIKETSKQTETQLFETKALKNSNNNLEDLRSQSKMSSKKTVNDNDKSNINENKSSKNKSPEYIDNLTERKSSSNLIRSNLINDNLERTVHQTDLIGQSSSNKPNSTNIFTSLKIKKKSTVSNEESYNVKNSLNKNYLDNQTTTLKTDRENKDLRNTSNEDCNDAIPKDKSSGKHIKQSNVTVNSLDSDFKKLSHQNLKSKGTKFLEINSTKPNSSDNTNNLYNKEIFESHSEANSRDRLKNIITNDSISNQSKFLEIPRSQSDIDFSMNKQIKMKMHKNNSFADNSLLIKQNIFESNDIKNENKCDLSSIKIPKKIQPFEAKLENIHSIRTSRKDSYENLNSNLESSKIRKSLINDKPKRSRSKSKKRERSNSSCRHLNDKQERKKQLRDSSKDICDDIKNIDSSKNHNKSIEVSQSLNDLVKLDYNTNSNKTSNNANENLDFEKFSHKTDSGNIARKILVPKAKISYQSYKNRASTSHNQNNIDKKAESCTDARGVVKDSNENGKQTKPLSDNVNFVENSSNIDQSKPSDAVKSRDPELTESLTVKNLEIHNRKSIDIKTDYNNDEKSLNLSPSQKKLLDKNDSVLNESSNLKNELHSLGEVEADSVENHCNTSRDPELTEVQTANNGYNIENNFEIHNEECNNLMATLTDHQSLQNEESINNFDNPIKSSVSPRAKSIDRCVEQNPISEDIGNCSQQISELYEDDSQFNERITRNSTNRQSVDYSIIDNYRPSGNLETHQSPEMTLTNFDSFVPQENLDDSIIDNFRSFGNLETHQSPEMTLTNFDSFVPQENLDDSIIDNFRSFGNVETHQSPEMTLTNFDSFVPQENLDYSISDFDGLPEADQLLDEDGYPIATYVNPNPEFYEYLEFCKTVLPLLSRQNDQILSDESIKSFLRKMNLDENFVGEEFFDEDNPILDTDDFYDNLEPNFSEERLQFVEDFPHIDNLARRRIRVKCLWFAYRREPGLTLYRVPSGFSIGIDLKYISETMLWLLRDDVRCSFARRNR